jgi:hypothetical protein
MGAGLSTKQINSRIYNRLQTIKRQLERANVPVAYRHKQLLRFEIENTSRIGGWNISYQTIRASNGETAGAPSIYITSTIQGDFRFGGFSNQHDTGSFDAGIAKLIELFSEPVTVSKGDL